MDVGEKAVTDLAYHIKEEKKVLIMQYSPDRKLVKYLEELIKPHQYWDQKPTLKDGAQQQWGNV